MSDLIIRIYLKIVEMNNGKLFIQKRKIKRSLIVSTYNYYSLCSNMIHERINSTSFDSENKNRQQGELWSILINYISTLWRWRTFERTLI